MILWDVYGNRWQKNEEKKYECAPWKELLTSNLCKRASLIIIITCYLIIQAKLMTIKRER